MTDRDRAVAYLEQAPLENIDMLENLRHFGAQVLAADEEGVLLRADNGLLMLSCADEAAERFCSGLPPAELFLAHGQAAAQAAIRATGFSVDMRCRQTAWLGAQPPPVGDTGLEMRTLGPEWEDFVQQHYGLDIGGGYMRGRLEAGVMVGAFTEGEIAGFAGEHAEHTMGMLEVLPAYRRRGVGRALTAHLVARNLAQGRVPHAQADVDNHASLTMQQSMGFAVGTGVLYWLW